MSEFSTESIICYCGHNCSKCVTYNATKKDDDNLKAQAKEFYQSSFGLIVPLDKIRCCGGKSDDIFELCIDCPFVKCCRSKGIDFCKSCDEYPCKMIAEYENKYVNKCNQIKEE